MESNYCIQHTFFLVFKKQGVIVRILIVGSGGREHALAWKLSQSPNVTEIFVAPGNGGIEADNFQTVPIAVDDISGLVLFARSNNIDLVVPGPELCLTLGIVDAMQDAGIKCFGPDKFCARLEGSKTFAKAIMSQGNVPTARGAHFSNYAAACNYVRKEGAPLVIKADGLAAGKGVVVAQTVDEAIDALDNMMRNKVFGDAGSIVVIEECLVGEEASLLCFCDGKHAVALPSAQDHKPIFDNDAGPNTGGMGAYSPAPIVGDDQIQGLVETTIMPILRAISGSGHMFKGVLYAGIMMTADGPKVLEYNTRFGDPECQPLLMRLQTPLDVIMDACIRGVLDTINIEYSKQSALGVVLAAAGYPSTPESGMVISGIDEADKMDGVKVFHSGTSMQDGKILASGGRVLCVTALGNDLESAQSSAYAALDKIHMDKAHYRKDIGNKGINHLKEKQ